MTTELVKKAISVFLRSPNPQVLCIRGKWGVGKTYIWDAALAQAKADGTVALPYYCYVSLFSLHSVDEVRQSIFENRVPTSEITVEPTLKSLKTNVKHLIDSAAKQVSRFSPYAQVPYLDKYISNLSGGFRQIVSLAVKDTIVCFDDFERKTLSAKDLLGLISQLRTQRACKAAIILNEDALSNDEKVEFRRYFEKVVDIPIDFSPTPEECAEIVMNGQDLLETEIRQRAIVLRISNIRILSRTKEVARELLNILAPYGNDVKRQAIQSLVLFLWSKYDDEAVPIKFIVERNHRPFALVGEKEWTDDERKWGTRLESYGFGHCDTFDMAILDGVERGFFDEDKVKIEAAQQDARHTVSASQDAIYQAWRKFHDSFVDNAQEVVEEICRAYLTHMHAVSRGNLDDAVIIFKRLGFLEKATNLINAYVEINKNKIESVDETSNHFHPIVKDQEFRTKLSEVVEPRKSKSIREILLLSSKGSYQPDDEQTILDLSVDDFFDLFKELDPDELNSIIEAALFWRRVINASEPRKEMSARALAALEKIGRENELNAIRVQKYGVDPESAPTASDDP